MSSMSECSRGNVFGRLQEMVENVDDPATVAFYATRKFVNHTFPMKWNCPSTIVETTFISMYRNAVLAYIVGLFVSARSEKTL